MELTCFSCHKVIAITDGRVGRKEECQHCGADLHVCKNCQHYDRSAYNECREPQADRVQDKERSNFCDYFTPRAGGSNSAVSKADELRAKAEALFKNPSKK